MRPEYIYQLNFDYSKSKRQISWGTSVPVRPKKELQQTMEGWYLCLSLKQEEDLVISSENET